jgi:hypothetical protein
MGKDNKVGFICHIKEKQWNEDGENCMTKLIISTVMIHRRMKKMMGHAAFMEEKQNAHRVLVGKPEGKRSLG